MVDGSYTLVIQKAYRENQGTYTFEIDGMKCHGELKMIGIFSNNIILYLRNNLTLNKSIRITGRYLNSFEKPFRLRKG